MEDSIAYDIAKNGMLNSGTSPSRKYMANRCKEKEN